MRNNGTPRTDQELRKLKLEAYRRNPGLLKPRRRRSCLPPVLALIMLFLTVSVFPTGGTGFSAPTGPVPPQPSVFLPSNDSRGPEPPARPLADRSHRGEQPQGADYE